jgi:hypothetical protein
MAEITPITPYPPVHAIQKVERDERQKRNPPKQQQSKPDQTKTDNLPAEHIDEIV